ncbi:sulfite exporter TauE/SafE family protein [Marinomonas sp. A79]|uniref:Probable membrane transporter protein n=1 Tax=Marinomonas vulgaris TaxID=2823372 RepID=A0ABS5H9V0_9GAMM|nr:sulfite exporter TauE/SafE family protein [Marinomonas vulgaris]MBR7888447.1 sulfite exporter TauE/SafE family protein [Marinomonas vulgaris]
MPSIDLILLLLLIGAATGSTTSLLSISPAVIAIPGMFFFFPVLGLSFDEWLLPVMAMSLTAFLPVHCFVWFRAMRKGDVDIQRLTQFASGVAMGGVIGAQLLSFMDVSVFKAIFSLVALLTLINLVRPVPFALFNQAEVSRFIRLPVGLLFGTLAVVSGNTTQSVSGIASHDDHSDKSDALQKRGTMEGLVVFASFAAMVGFLFPAQAQTASDMAGFVGAIHLPSACILAVSHGVFFWLCDRKGNALDRRVLSLSLAAFIGCSIIRFWV